MAAPRVAFAAAAFVGGNVIRAVHARRTASRSASRRSSPTRESSGEGAGQRDGQSQGLNNNRNARRQRTPQPRTVTSGRLEGAPPGANTRLSSNMMSEHLLPATILIWVLVGVIPAMYLKLTAQQDLLDRLAMGNLTFAIVCMSMWISKVFTLRTRGHQHTEPLPAPPPPHHLVQ